RQQMEIAQAQLDESTGQTDVLEAIRANLAAANVGAQLPSYQVGTARVPSTGPALLHADEMVLPAPVASWFRSAGVPLATTSIQAAPAINESVTQELRELRELLGERLSAVEAALAKVERAEKDGAAAVVGGVARVRDAVLDG